MYIYAYLCIHICVYAQIYVYRVNLIYVIYLGAWL